jgi:hypothetical protein
LGDLIKSYIREGIALKEQIADICYFMQGGVEWQSAWQMTFEDREIIVKRINKHLKDKNPNAKDYM